ncbi:M15 family metallopeptidase [Citricoccus sp. NR2]|uniref:M15 family metallopeptidase n=1 Tax=Citricoccus sp. NR2 TaxID=3004095 RepID=UPI0022DDA2CC|nr:M15 family metallopeptidase [Citricoccus sp. NR2]WBL17775.1 M15 family metallopeptidase [Citricoccus sp. NR2]
MTRHSAALTLMMITALLATGCTSENPATEEETVRSATPSGSPSTDTSATPPTTSTPATASPSSPATSAASTPEAAASGASGQQDPSSLTVVVNKQNPLNPPQWAPTDLTGLSVSTTKSGLQLRQPAADAAAALFAAAQADGVSLSVVSAYRSYDYQVGTYQHWVNQQGAAAADRISARPGYSEHQTGLAMDVVGSDGACTLETCFQSTPAGRWVAEHAAEHGWVIRYPDGAESVTGYSYEPWHLRYLGTEAAQEIMDAGGVLETAWGLPAAPGY